MEATICNHPRDGITPIAPTPLGIDSKDVPSRSIAPGKRANS